MGADAFIGGLGSSQKKLLQALPKAGKSKVIPTDFDGGDDVNLAPRRTQSLDSADEQSKTKKSYWTQIKRSREIHKDQGDSAPGAEMWSRINQFAKAMKAESPAARDLAADLTHSGQLDDDVVKKHVVKPTVERIHFDQTVSLWIFHIEHPTRAFCLALVRHPYFERTVLALILMSSVLLALEMYPETAVVVAVVPSLTSQVIDESDPSL